MMSQRKLNFSHLTKKNLPADYNLSLFCAKCNLVKIRKRKGEKKSARAFKNNRKWWWEREKSFFAPRGHRFFIFKKFFFLFLVLRLPGISLSVRLKWRGPFPLSFQLFSLLFSPASCPRGPFCIFNCSQWNEKYPKVNHVRSTLTFIKEEA